MVKVIMKKMLRCCRFSLLSLLHAFDWRRSRIKHITCRGHRGEHWKHSFLLMTSFIIFKCLPYYVLQWMRINNEDVNECTTKVRSIHITYVDACVYSLYAMSSSVLFEWNENDKAFSVCSHFQMYIPNNMYNTYVTHRQTESMYKSVHSHFHPGWCIFILSFRMLTSNLLYHTLPFSVLHHWSFLGFKFHEMVFVYEKWIRFPFLRTIVF